VAWPFENTFRVTGAHESWNSRGKGASSAEYFEEHARDLEDLLSVLSEKEKQPNATKLLITLDNASLKNKSAK
jgi:hypothetical protein